ncbi:MAG: TlpA disulfide reductase family protein [Luteibaculum sp.]
MRSTLYILGIITFITLQSCQQTQEQNSTELNDGFYTLELDLGEEKLKVPLQNTKDSIVIYNASERIALPKRTSQDSLFAAFNVFDTGLELKITSDSTATGIWNKYYKDNYTLAAQLYPSSNTTNSRAYLDTVKYEVTFSPNTPDSYPAIGLFSISDNRITGSFATETGDYRFLAGEINDNAFHLNTFDGSHAFVFTGKIKGDSIQEGMFYSGNHWKEPFIGIENDSYQLTNPDSITSSKQPVQFSFLAEDSSLFRFNDYTYKDTAVIIQILGSWCPNCLDETYFLSELQSIYAKQPLAIIGIAFESKTDYAYYANQIQKLKSTTKANYPILLGGKASKQVASDTLVFLDEIKSFPTTIFLDKKHKIQRIHTGFYGPGTGSYYDKFREETLLLLDKVLAN